MDSQPRQRPNPPRRPSPSPETAADPDYQHLVRMAAHGAARPELREVTTNMGMPRAEATRIIERAINDGRAMREKGVIPPPPAQPAPAMPQASPQFRAPQPAQFQPQQMQPPQVYPQQAYPQQMYPPQVYPQQMHPPQAYPPAGFQPGPTRAPIKVGSMNVKGWGGVAGGALMLLIGVIASVTSYQSASSSAGSGRYTVFTGLIVVGAITLIGGVGALIKKE